MKTATLTKVDGPALPGLNFQWRDRKGAFHYPQQMETRHLFFTIRMIWNHHMPIHMRLEPYRRYRFGPFYTTDYLKAAVYFLFRELVGRRDIEDDWQRDIYAMRSWFEAQDIPDIKELSRG